LDSSAVFLQFLFSGLTVGSIYALTAIGFTIIYNCTQVVNFAQGEFVMLGAMLAAVLVAGPHLSLPVAFLLAVVIATAVGGLLAACLTRPLRTGETVTLIIITVGASILIRGVAMLLWGKEAIPVPPFSGEGSVHIWGATLQIQSLWVFGVTGALVLLLWMFFKFTLMGRAMRACSSCKGGAKLVGININRMTTLSFALGAAVGAIGGVVASPITYAHYGMGTMLGLKGFCAAILGGLGNFTGGIIAGVGLGILEQMGAGYLSSEYKDAIAFVILLVVLLSRPEGLLKGRKSG
jgi:branched-chain amino acid transport system permease protein